MAHRLGKVKIVWSSMFAYAIGVIATDGNVSPDLRHIHITSKDKEMITNVKQCLGLTNTISQKARGGSTEKKYYVLQFGDKNFVEYLIEIGITPRKSKTIQSVTMPTVYFIDFLRGCLDGDGSISISKHPQSMYPQYKVRFCSASRAFLEWILLTTRTSISITGGSIAHAPQSSVYTLTFAKKDSIGILKKMYTEQSVCLTRKKKIASIILKKEECI